MLTSKSCISMITSIDIRHWVVINALSLIGDSVEWTWLWLPLSCRLVSNRNIVSINHISAHHYAIDSPRLSTNITRGSWAECSDSAWYVFWANKLSGKRDLLVVMAAKNSAGVALKGPVCLVALMQRIPNIQKASTGWPRSSRDEIPCVFPEFSLCEIIFPCVIFK